MVVGLDKFREHFAGHADHYAVIGGSPMHCAAWWCCTTERQNTHVTDLREVLYPWHPWFGRSVYVHSVIDKPGDAVFRCNLTGRRSDRLLEVPIWMFDRAACASCRRSGSSLSNICYTMGKTDNSVRMNLVSKSFLGFLVDPLGRHPRFLTLQETGIAVRGAGSPWIGLEDISTGPSGKKGLLSLSLSLDLGGGRNLALPAEDTTADKKFADVASTAWTDFNREEPEKEDVAVRRILQALKVPDAYPAACRVAPLVHDAADLTPQL